MTKKEIIAELKRMLEDADMDQDEFCRKNGIKHEEYYSYLLGWTLGSIKRTIRKAEDG